MKRMGICLGLFLAVSFLFYAAELNAQMGPGMMGPGYGRGPGYGPWDMGPGMMWGWGGWLGMIFMIIFWILVIAGAIYLLKWLIGNFQKNRDSATETSRALEILKERYARGEISREEFNQIKQELRKIS
ncbi:MAG: SHOCT domain-containing protein [bacterium]